MLHTKVGSSSNNTNNNNNHWWYLDLSQIWNYIDNEKKLLWKVFSESNSVQPREFPLGQVPQNKLKERKPLVFKHM